MRNLQKFAIHAPTNPTFAKFCRSATHIRVFIGMWETWVGLFCGLKATEMAILHVKFCKLGVFLAHVYTLSYISGKCGSGEMADFDPTFTHFSL